MGFLQDIKFPYFPSKINTVKPLGSVTLEQFIMSHKYPKPEIQGVFDQIAVAAEEGNIALKDKLKQENLYYFTPSVWLENGRSYDDIEYFNPLMVAEFDKIDFAGELKEYIFEKVDSCVCAYLSPSRKGVKFLFRIPVVQSVDEYKEYFCGLGYYMDQIEGFDPANFNCSLPLFLSHDKDLLYREDQKEWLVKGEKVNAFKKGSPEDFVELEDVTEEDVEKIKSIIDYTVDKIEDGAHPQIVSLATAMGGYVGAGYCEFSELEGYLHDAISGNAYMQKNVNGYQKTASEMMRRGMSSPLYLKRHRDDKTE